MSSFAGASNARTIVLSSLQKRRATRVHQIVDARRLGDYFLLFGPEGKNGRPFKNFGK